MPEVTIPYKPREQFLAYHASDKRFAVSVCHRRAGKTVARINRLIRAGCTINRNYPPGRFAYISPYRNQSKKIAWMYLKHFANGLIQAGGKVNEQELTITMPRTTATIELFGADNAEAMRGNYFDGVVTDEAQGIPRSTLSQIILPCLADYQGWLDCSGTPRGWENLLGELVKMAREDPAHWYLHILKASQSGILSESELTMQRSIMSENEYEAEYECNFDAAITGAVYGKWIAEADKGGRLVSAIEPADLIVHTAWDLGFDDSTAIWWFQILKGEIHVIDYYENNGQDIAHYCEVLHTRGRERSIRYGKHYVPHDAAQKLLAAGGRSIVQQAYGLGVTMHVVPATTQQNGIEAARKTLERTWFDSTRCEMGLNALRHYQFEFDADRKAYRSVPRHDWSSHGADAFEIIGQVWQVPIEPPKPEKPRFLHEAKASELFWPEKRQNQITRI